MTTAPSLLRLLAAWRIEASLFYAGFGVSLGGIIPYRGFQLGAFDTIVGLNPWKNDTGMMGFFSTFAAAQTAIIAGAGISSPFDSVRRRLPMQAEKPVEQHIYKGTVDRMKKIAAEEGMASTRVSSPPRSAVSAEPWCWCFTTEPSTIWAWAARAVASGVSRPTVLLVSFSSTHLQLQFVRIKKKSNGQCVTTAPSLPRLLAAWRIEASLFFGFPYWWNSHIATSLVRCPRKNDTLTCLFFTALWIRQRVNPIDAGKANQRYRFVLLAKHCRPRPFHAFKWWPFLLEWHWFRLENLITPVIHRAKEIPMMDIWNMLFLLFRIIVGGSMLFSHFKFNEVVCIGAQVSIFLMTVFDVLFSILEGFLISVFFTIFPRTET